MLDLELIRQRSNEYHAAQIASRSDNTMLNYNRLVNAEHEIKHRAVADTDAMIDEIERLRMALDTVGSSIYTQGKGAKWEQSILKFIREQLGRT